MINATTKLFQNIETLKSYSKDTAPHRIIFNVPIVGRPCSICGKGRPPLPYTIVDADYKPICGKCALEKNLPIASVWDSYERLIDIPALRLERDGDFPYGDFDRIIPVLSIGIWEMQGGRELIERAEKEIMEKIEDVRELLIRNKVIFFRMACVQEQTGKISI
jgi:hypothetical protein